MTPKIASCNPTSKLPTEMKCFILTFLTKKADLKHVRLVNKDWGTIAATQLWREFRTDLIESQSKNLDCLINGTNEFFSSVKKLIITSSQLDPLELAPVRLIDLLCALPHNGLHTFICDLGMDAQALQLLLRRQEQLVSIAVVPVDGKDASGPPVYNWIKASLSGIQSMKIRANGYSIRFGAWLSFMTGLRRLHVAGVNDRSFAKGWQLSPETLRLPLQELITSDIQLPSTPNWVFCCLELAKLKTLALSSCTKPVEFLHSLGIQLAKGKPSLEIFGYSNQQHQGKLFEIERFLECFSGLIELHVDCDRAERLSPTCSKRHASSLRFAFLNHQKLWHAHPPAQCYHVFELEAIAKICPNLEQIGIALGRYVFDKEQVKDNFHLVDPSKRNANGTFLAKSLEAVAKFSKLELLRLTIIPTVYGMPALDSVDTRDQEVFMERFASEIFGFLAKHGSAIETLVMKPTQSFEWVSPQPDRNGHTWPDFFYQKASLYMRGQHFRDVAIPITEEKLVSSMMVPSIEYERRFDL